MLVDVIPLKFGPVFKRVFSKPEVFNSFASDVLGIPINIDKVHTEYEYPEPIGFVKSRYDLFAEDIEQRVIVEIQQVKEGDFFDRFLYHHIISIAEQVKGYKEYCFERTVYTIVVLTSVPEDKSVEFSFAHADLNLIDERNKIVPVYHHRLIFLVPRLVNENTPPAIKAWMEFIKDSLDGKMDEGCYIQDPFHSMLEEMRRTINPDELTKIKDEAAWEQVKASAIDEGREEERKKIALSMLKHGMNIEQVAAITGFSKFQIKLLRNKPV